MRFLLVDRIDELTPGVRIRGAKQVAMSEDVLEHHFPGRPVFPGVLVLEAMVQLAGWLEAASSGFTTTVLLAGVGRAAFYALARPGDRLDIEVEQVSPAGESRRSYRGVARVDGARQAVIELEGEVVPLDELEDPAMVRARLAWLARQRRW